MYDEDRPDLEWDEEVERNHLVAAQVHSPGLSGQQLPPDLNPRERAIRPLPKRQRLSEQELSSTINQEQSNGGGVDQKLRQPNKDDQQDEGGPVVPASASAASREPALEYRTAADDDYHDQRGGTASNHPSKARDEDETATKTSLDSSRPEDFDDDDRCRHLDDSPPTSPATSRAGRSFKEDDEAEEELERSPDYFALFGSEGQEIRRSLRHASTFSAAGLCGGLGLAGLHPSLVPPAERRAGRASSSAGAGGAAGDDEVDEDGYALVERAFTSEHGGRLVPVARVGGNNKKKRKIPGVSVGTGGDDDDRTFDAEDGPEPTTVIGPDYNGRAPGIRSDFGSDPPTSKAPVNPPTTAKAALAKLRLRPLHVSLSRLSLSHRRHLNRHHRSFVAKQKPLKLPPPAFYSAPAMYRDGPPPLPPGSGLKGSRALKAAMKAEKDREREKARIKELLGGGNLRLIDLWDPEGKEESTAAIDRANRRRRLAAADAKSTYPTPPSSADGDRPPILPILNSFSFVEPPPHTVGARWTALNDQIERFRLAKERAAKARENERERRKEKEQEAAAQAQAEDALQASAVKAPPPPPAGKRNSSAAIRPPVNPTPSTALNDRSPNVPIVSPTTYTNEPPVPPAPPRKPKKGKKKRSAHANALNVHHRDNYVPSRIPTSSVHHGIASLYHDGSTTPPLTSWPASEEAIAAAGGSRPNTSYFAGQDEWLCAFCDYDLFFGPDPKKAIKKRKDVLKVRKKARDRASKAAGGAAPAAPAPATPGTEEPVGETQSTEGQAV